MSRFSFSAEQLKDLLECPVCLKVPRQFPVYQCHRGHCVCSNCHSRLANCPVCLAPLRRKIRSLISEKVLAQIPHGCRFTNLGCNVEKTRAALKSHEKDCPYRLVGCVNSNCRQQVSIRRMVDHVMKDHKKEDFIHIMGNSSRSKLHVSSRDFAASRWWIPTHIVYEGQHFFFKCLRSESCGWFIWMYMIGSSKECEEYVYTVQITSDDGVEKLTYQGRCISLDVKKEQLLDSGNCLILHDSTAKRFVANESIICHIQVVRKEASKMEGGY